MWRENGSEFATFIHCRDLYFRKECKNKIYVLPEYTKLVPEVVGQIVLPHRVYTTLPPGRPSSPFSPGAPLGPVLPLKPLGPKVEKKNSSII